MYLSKSGGLRSPRPGSVNIHVGARRVCDFRPPVNLTRDEVLNNLTFYWLTNTGISSTGCTGRTRSTSSGQGVTIPPQCLSSRRRSTRPAQLGRAGLLQPHLLQRGRPGCHFAAWQESCYSPLSYARRSGRCGRHCSASACTWFGGSRVAQIRATRPGRAGQRSPHGPRSPFRWSTACLRRSAPTARSFAERHDPAWMEELRLTFATNGRRTAPPSSSARAGHPRKARSAPLPLELPSGKPSRWLSRPRTTWRRKRSPNSSHTPTAPIRSRTRAVRGASELDLHLWAILGSNSDLLGVNELHASRLRSSTPVKASRVI